MLDGERRQVFNAGGVPLPLTPRLFNALELFVARPGELIQKDDLMQALWPGRVVEENSLSQVVHGLRRALSEHEEGVGTSRPNRGGAIDWSCRSAALTLLTPGRAHWLPNPLQDRPSPFCLFWRSPHRPYAGRSKWG
jgi:hypothetical protein